MGDNNAQGHGQGQGHGRGLLVATKASTVRLGFLIVSLFVAAILSTRLLDSTLTSINTPSLPKSILSPITTKINPQNPPKISKKTLLKIEIPLNCSVLTKTGPTNYYPQNFQREEENSQSPPSTCPQYFRWIHEDLRPWRETGITRDMVERARRTATFRLVVISGRAYVDWYHKCFQSRDTFTLWGILQLLRRYPGQVPDLDMMFDCVDWPVIKSNDYPRSVPPPPLFRYCGDDYSLDIVFPDWSFWGWPEINIKPWESLLNELKEGNKRSRWLDREPYAYWKGNPAVAATRRDLMNCNVSEKQDWNARLYAQDWIQEQRQGFKQSDLASQCIHRYKIYIEGSAWSVSEKYILACDSLTLLVKPKYYDFFTRSLIPEQHYWPIRDDDKCRSIKFAVDWGNSHKDEAQAIGKEASKFIQEELKMDYVYDYMFHLLNEYSKLFKYKPTVPAKAYELSSETMACPAQGFARECMMESMSKGPATTSFCTLPPPYDPQTLQSIIARKINSTEQVEKLEKQYWENENKQI